MIALLLARPVASSPAQTPAASPGAPLAVSGNRDGAITPQDFGAVCDNATDDGKALQAAIDYAGTYRVRLRLPRCSYAIGRQIVVSQPIDIDADASSNLRFTNPAACGLVVDLTAAAARYGLNTIELGGLYAPSVDRAFHFPGYPGNWSTTDRAACDAVTIRGGSRIDLGVKYILGFRAGVTIEATHDAHSGASAPNNVNLRINTADILEYGVKINGGPADAGTMAAIIIEMNTVFAKYPVYFDTARHGVGQVNVRVTGQAFTNETDGACVFGNGGNLVTSSIDILWCYAGFSPSDSPRDTPRTLQLPYLAGSAPSNGTHTDGHATLGYWNSSNNRISIGVASDLGNLPGGSAADGDTVARVRDAGANDVRLPFVIQPKTPLPLASQPGEARFAKGAGSLARTIPVRLAVPALAPGASASFYAYAGVLSAAAPQAIRILPQDHPPTALAWDAEDEAALANRQVRITVRNTSSSSTANWTGNAWLKID
ncbi:MULTISPECIES: hypothetical protein [unclassified Novosphingobium]|uniref:hypothetical protein n=1 Tax=unclassified Novosphingobium TaxID=2644732 RepID=UPI00146B6D01|nr:MULTISPECIES: hypothetical protein [unclassified Novosphingobium]NMN03189.1 hypothetical protein [Novosphingobium sp. SG919]NMN86821.1 hypothetical protein [Novosphingobium sp. SG916]